MYLSVRTTCFTLLRLPAKFSETRIEWAVLTGIL